ncbi:lysozyme inhibitor LprI family protein [Azospirillum canadense]|uniref:lysozyme inhibitor LprI family protein n=1 Tax=Azospirillum canadense TaxID=403962 RepID=UPI002227F9B3|nr:lysozyme inhibitor LprI family protein [Azospirillum canadense]MCW2242301.1 hypothetical protein [Azospirillum canadense]
MKVLRLSVVAFALATAAFGSKESKAFDCSKAYLAVDHVICSDPNLVESVDRLQGAWNTLRKSLDEDRRKTLTAEQKQWISDYTQRCGVPGRGAPTADVIARSRACVGENLAARTAYLASLGNSTSAPAGGEAASGTVSRPAGPPAASSKPRPIIEHIDDNHLTIMGEPPWLPRITGTAWRIQLFGPIDEDAARRFSAFLDSNNVPDGSSVILNSPGGNLAQGVALGREFRRRGFSTTIGVRRPTDSGINPGYCYSACATAFLGGKFRSVPSGSKYGVHRFAFSRSTGQDSDAAQVVSALLVSYLGEMGIEPGLFPVMTRVASSDINVLSQEDLERYHVVHSGTEPKWTIESLDFGLYVKGQQETWNGTSKAIFLCNEDKEINFTAMFTGGEESFDLAARNPPQTLTLDQTPIVIKGLKGALLEHRGEFVAGHYVLPANVAAMVASSNTIRYALQPLNPDFYYGYEMKITAEARKMLKGLIASCQK